jgi:hypothetical protein
VGLVLAQALGDLRLGPGMCPDHVLVEVPAPLRLFGFPRLGLRLEVGIDPCGERGEAVLHLFDGAGRVLVEGVGRGLRLGQDALGLGACQGDAQPYA